MALYNPPAGNVYPPRPTLFFSDAVAGGETDLELFSLGSTIILHSIFASNAGTVERNLFFTFDTDPTELFRMTLPRLGGTVFLNLIGTECAQGTVLLVTTSAGGSGNVYLTIGYADPGV